MRVLVVGAGGREHALAWKLAQNPTVDRVYGAPGNPGIASVATLAAIDVMDIGALAAFAEEHQIDLTVVGPEAPLVAGLADEFRSRGMAVFGPGSAAAEIEGSKVFCRRFAQRHGIPMAEGECFDDPDEAVDYAKTLAAPLVVKADGLAAGKGVVICPDHEAARAAVDDMMRERSFGAAGSRVVVEEHLDGRETSLLALTDGEAVIPLEPAQDYKRALDGDEGPNTGGMGACSPVRWLEPEMRAQAVREIVEPVIRGLAEEDRRYVGCLYAGLMITEKGPKLIEVNARFGDPEAQVLLPRFGSDFLEAVLASVEGNLRNYRVHWRPEAAVCVVIASGGYPGSYATGLPIEGVDEADALADVTVFHAGTAVRDGCLVSAGGRVLNVVGLGANVARARDRAYEAAARIRLDKGRYRRDIASGIDVSS